MPGASGSTGGVRPCEILFLNRRDCSNPEGGGSEIYVETVARTLAAAGNRVTVHSATFDGSRADEWIDGVHMVRGGGKLSTYADALRRLRSGQLGHPDVIVDVQNGIPYASPLVHVAPTVVLVHHVHREQWPVVYDPVRARIGWWVESRLAPRLYRHCRYVAVSTATRDELVALGVDADRISIVHNGVSPRTRGEGLGSPTPRILVLGRLVPHKQVEHVLAAAAELRQELPELRVSIVGDGWWREEVAAEADRLGVGDIVELHGFVDDRAKQRELSRAWVLALPSLKEGWGLAITEAAAHGVPAVAYRSAGGVVESIVDGSSGLLVAGGEPEFTAALARVLRDPELRQHLSDGARAQAGAFSWRRTVDGFAAVLGEVVGHPIPVTDACEATLHLMPAAQPTSHDA